MSNRTIPAVAVVVAAFSLLSCGESPDVQGADVQELIRASQRLAAESCYLREETKESAKVRADMIAVQKEVSARQLYETDLSARAAKIRGALANGVPVAGAAGMLEDLTRRLERTQRELAHFHVRLEDLLSTHRELETERRARNERALAALDGAIMHRTAAHRAMASAGDPPTPKMVLAHADLHYQAAKIEAFLSERR